MKKPLVSVIITTKNEEDNLPRLLQSIPRQTYSAIEIVVVDNNSRDNTKKIASRFTSNVFEKGPERSAQRNFGVSKAKGRYVMILDADMELTPKVVESCIKVISSSEHKALIIPEKTVGESFMAKVRNFERSMYMGDATIEVARFFEKKVFDEFGGYDKDLTGAEDYDLPYRISKKYSIGRAKEWIMHHEAQLTLPKQLKKKFTYAKSSASYAEKHPELVATQGNMLFRRAYLRNWKNFVQHPIFGLSFIIIRFLEASSAIAGYISAVGIKRFLQTTVDMIRKKG